MTKYFFLLLMFSITAVFAEPDRFVTGTVKADNYLNVRVKPGTQYFIVSTLNPGDKVKIYRKVDKWYEIAAPKDSSVWVAGHLLANSKTRREVNLRSGPSRDYQAYRTEPPGVELQIIEKKGHKGWFKVKPPVDLKAWVNVDYVDVNEQELKNLINPEAQRKLILIDNDSGDFKGFLKNDESVKPEFVLPFVSGTEKLVKLKGQIVPLKSGAVYVTHALISVDRKANIVPVAYLRCEKASLNIWQDKVVTIAGIQKLVKDWKLPVIEVKTVIPENKKSNHKK
jgi:uncharacterized protein YgiM (DUF1202 family)